MRWRLRERAIMQAYQAAVVRARQHGRQANVKNNLACVAVSCLLWTGRRTPAVVMVGAWHGAERGPCALSFVSTKLPTAPISSTPLRSSEGYDLPLQSKRQDPPDLVRRLHARLLPEHKMVSQPAFRAQPANHLEAFSCTSGSAACSYEGLILRPVSI
jgi:hypothetical protein